MNFASLTGLSDSYGNVVQIADAAGRVIWSAVTNKPVILEVEKITSSTYAAETTYENEQFILLDIYPKTNGTVNVTYGGLTKTITDTSGAESPNSQQVFFGTFNGVSDSVTTPASGELIIEGDYTAFGAGAYVRNSKSSEERCGCIINIVDMGSVTCIPEGAFSGCSELTKIPIPNSVKKVGIRSLMGLAVDAPFYNCTGLTSITFPKNVIEIGSGKAFSGCTNLKTIYFDDPYNWRVTKNTLFDDTSEFIDVDVTNAENNVTLLMETYLGYMWVKK